MAAKPDPRSNGGNALVYPTGLAISDDGDTLYVANNMGDSLGLIHELRGARRLERVPLLGVRDERLAGDQTFVYPYGVVALGATRPGTPAGKVYVSCWNQSAVAVVQFGGLAPHVSYIPVARHPTKLLLNRARNLLYVVNSNADSVSVIDTSRDVEAERINVRLSEAVPLGNSPESIALSPDERTLYVANAHSNSVAIITLAERLMEYNAPAR